MNRNDTLCLSIASLQAGTQNREGLLVDSLGGVVFGQNGQTGSDCHGDGSEREKA
jgi:hypothetical protein